VSLLDSLESELTEAGIPGRRRRRILTEFADHISENPAENPTAELGSPHYLARQFADELGTSLARTAALRAFGCLTVCALAFTLMFATGGLLRGLPKYGQLAQLGRPVELSPPARLPDLYTDAMLLCVAAAQLALAAGALALLRAHRLRGRPVIAAAEAAILNRRAAVGVVAGMITMAALPFTAVAVPNAYAGNARTYALIIWALASLLLASMVPRLLAAARLRPTAQGAAGDLTADLGSRLCRYVGGTPWRIAIVLSAVIALVLSAVGVGTGDPYDGLLRGLLDGAACMTGFTLLGGYLGLRTSSQRTTT
jgi:hypothetical protein